MMQWACFMLPYSKSSLRPGCCKNARIGLESWTLSLCCITLQWWDQVMQHNEGPCFVLWTKPNWSVAHACLIRLYYTDGSNKWLPSKEWVLEWTAAELLRHCGDGHRVAYLYTFPLCLYLSISPLSEGWALEQVCRTTTDRTWQWGVVRITDS